MKNWENRLTKEELNDVNDIIGKMQCSPKPTVNEFLNAIANSLDRFSKQSEVRKYA